MPNTPPGRIVQLSDTERIAIGRSVAADGTPMVLVDHQLRGPRGAWTSATPPLVISERDAESLAWRLWDAATESTFDRMREDLESLEPFRKNPDHLGKRKR